MYESAVWGFGMVQEPEEKPLQPLTEKNVAALGDPLALALGNIETTRGGVKIVGEDRDGSTIGDSDGGVAQVYQTVVANMPGVAMTALAGQLRSERSGSHTAHSAVQKISLAGVESEFGLRLLCL